MSKSPWGGVPEKAPKKCAMCRKDQALKGHAVCETCLPNVPVRKPVEDTLAMIAEALGEDQDN